MGYLRDKHLKHNYYREKLTEKGWKKINFKNAYQKKADSYINNIR